MKRFTLLETNFKGAPALLELHPCMAIVGAGRSGKTRFRDAFMVAMTGRHPARTHSSQLFEALAAEGAQEIYARLYAGPKDAPSASVIFRAGPSVPKKAERFVTGWMQDIAEDDVLRAFPYDSAGAIFEYGKDRTRRVLFQRWGALKNGVTPPKGLDESDLALWREAFEAVKTDSASDIGAEDFLVDMQKWFSREAKAANAAAGRADDDEGEEIEEAAGAEMLPMLEAQLVEAKLFESFEGHHNELARLRQEVAVLRTQQQPAAEEEAAKPLVLPPKPVEPPAPAPVVQAVFDEALLTRTEILVQLVRTNYEAKHSNCPLCGAATELKDLLNRGEARVRALREQRDQTKMAQTQARAPAVSSVTREWEETCRRLAAAHRAANDRAIALRAQISYLETRIEQLEKILEASPSYEGPKAALIQQQLDAVRATIVAAQAAQEHRLAARKARKRAQIAKDLEAKTKVTLDKCVKSAILLAEEAINKFAPEDIKISVNTADYAWEATGEDGRPHDRFLMCGTERAATVLALASAWSQPLGILWIDDDDLRGLDAKVMLKQFDRLERAVADGLLNQVVVLSNRPHEMPSHWPKHVVEEHK